MIADQPDEEACVDPAFGDVQAEGGVLISHEQHPEAQVVDEDSDRESGSIARETDDEDDRRYWKGAVTTPSLPETFQTVPVAPPGAPWWQKLLSFTGVGFIVSVGYMDPGNWATDIAGGSQFGYDLLFAVLLASLAAMLLQYLSLKLGVATGRDLAQACRDSFHPRIVIVLWLIMEIAMMATDMAELLGAAIAFYLLFGIPLPAGVVIMGVDVLFILVAQQSRLRMLEAFVMVLVAIIFGCLVYVIAMTKPNWGEVAYGFVPKSHLFTNSRELFLAIGILGATVMPHNLFLHSSLVQSRKYPRNTEGKQFAVKYATIDSNMSLVVAFFVNAFILIVAASAFHEHYNDTGDIFDAFNRLPLVLGSQTPAIVFAVALLVSGQQASLTGTLAGQIVMEGMLEVKISPWKRRFVTRILAILPTVIVTIVMGENSIVLLLFSQVTLSMTLSFATFPLWWLTSSEGKMGKQFVNSLCTKIASGIVVLTIFGLNAYILCSPSTWEFSV